MKINQSILEVLYNLNVNHKINLETLKKCTDKIIELPEQNRIFFLGILFHSLMNSKYNVEYANVILQSIFQLDNFDRNKIKKHLLKDKVVEYVGSGKKGLKTINISTISAFVASSIGAKIIKKGSKAVSSTTGSADFMEMIGSNLIENNKLNNALSNMGIIFVSIENTIPNFNKIYSNKFYSPHILSFGLAALITPIIGDCIFYGLSHPNVKASLSVLQNFGIKEAKVVSSTNDSIHFVDEIIFSSNIIEGTIKDNTQKIENHKYYDFIDYANIRLKDIYQKATPEENIHVALKILTGNGTYTQNSIIAINSAYLLLLSEKCSSLKEGYLLSMEAIKKQLGLKKIKNYIEYTNGNFDKLEKIINLY